MKNITQLINYIFEKKNIKLLICVYNSVFVNGQTGLYKNKLGM